jgi:hypothetical protein
MTVSGLNAREVVRHLSGYGLAVPFRGRRRQSAEMAGKAYAG